MTYDNIPDHRLDATIDSFHQSLKYILDSLIKISYQDIDQKSQSIISDIILALICRISSMEIHNVWSCLDKMFDKISKSSCFPYLNNYIMDLMTECWSDHEKQLYITNNLYILGYRSSSDSDIRYFIDENSINQKIENYSIKKWSDIDYESIIENIKEYIENYILDSLIQIPYQCINQKAELIISHLIIIWIGYNYTNMLDDNYANMLQKISKSSRFPYINNRIMDDIIEKGFVDDKYKNDLIAYVYNLGYRPSASVASDDKRYVIDENAINKKIEDYFKKIRQNKTWEASFCSLDIFQSRNQRHIFLSFKGKSKLLEEYWNLEYFHNFCKKNMLIRGGIICYK